MGVKRGAGEEEGRQLENVCGLPKIEHENEKL